MQLEKLQLDLRPRKNQQALDLGYALLRLDVYNVYMAWLIPVFILGSIICLVTWLEPDLVIWLWLLIWIPMPLLERAPLYVLSRLVFGERVSWREALRAWSKQLGGGLRMCTIGRFNTARGLYHAIYQLEGARGKMAGERRQILAQAGTSHSAYWFGVICAHFVMVLQFGFLGLISLFISSDEFANPFAILLNMDEGEYSRAKILLTQFSYLLALGIIGPIFVACSFTLYLNRRATLEAWDLEIALRQITPPQSRQQNSRALSLVLAGTLTSLLFLLDPASSWAANESTNASANASGNASSNASTSASANTSSKLPATVNQPDDGKGNLDKCEEPEFPIKSEKVRTKPPHDAAQEAFRAELTQILASEGLRNYDCKYGWHFKKSEKKATKRSERPSPAIDALLGPIIKVLAIAILVCAIAWLLYHYRQNLGAWFTSPAQAPVATEIGGLDIRPESLPSDITSKVMELWQQGKQRAALALLYRATLSRLVEENGLRLLRGFTEGDCLRAAEHAHAREQLHLERLRLASTCTTIWRDGAYGQRWPATDAVLACCTAWQDEFGKRGTA